METTSTCQPAPPPPPEETACQLNKKNHPLSGIVGALNCLLSDNLHCAQWNSHLVCLLRQLSLRLFLPATPYCQLCSTCTSFKMDCKQAEPSFSNGVCLRILCSGQDSLPIRAGITMCRRTQTPGLKRGLCAGSTGKLLPGHDNSVSCSVVLLHCSYSFQSYWWLHYSFF